MDKFFAKKAGASNSANTTTINTSSKAVDHEMKDESAAAFAEQKPKFTPWVEK